MIWYRDMIKKVRERDDWDGEGAMWRGEKCREELKIPTGHEAPSVRRIKTPLI